MKVDRMRRLLVEDALQRVPSPTLERPGGWAGARAREVPESIESLRDDDEQLVEIAALLSDEDDWNAVVGMLNSGGADVELYTDDRKFRAYLDDVLSVARQVRTTED